MKLKAERLSKEAFSEFGFYADLQDPKSNRFGESPVEFFPDIVQMHLPVNVASISSVVVYPREYVIDGTEYHSHTCEATLPIDGDMLIHVGPPTKGDVPYDRMRVFRVPRGTIVVLKPGVWHGAPFAADGKRQSALVILSERAYANDCFFVAIPEEKRLEIDIS